MRAANRKRRIISLGTGAMAVLVVVLAYGGAGTRSIAIEQDVPTPWSEMEKFFVPPEQYKGRLGNYRSFMKFDDGSRQQEHNP